MDVRVFKRNKTYWIRYSINGIQVRESLKTQDAFTARRIAKKSSKI